MDYSEKRTKIVATIGPTSDSPQTIRDFIKSGVNVFRFNLKHNSHKWHSERIKLVREVSNKLNIPVATLIDLQGPEIRIGNFLNDQIELRKNERVVFSTKEIPNKKTITINNLELIKKLDKGQRILIDDGHFVFEVTENITQDFVEAKVIDGGVLRNSKGASFPGLEIDIPTLIEKDFDDIAMGAREEVDFAALSFVRDKKSIDTLRKHIKKHNTGMKIISKIEKWEAIKNIDEIIEASDAIMVARGDLAVEIPLEQVPIAQKQIIAKCRKAKKPVIVATQCLKSMEKDPTPTRAEANDVANSVFDSTDAVMLSEETATGQYPVKAVQTMAKILMYTERFNKESYYIQPGQLSFEEGLSYGAYLLLDLYKGVGKEIKGIIVLTESGKTAADISSLRPKADIFAFTQSKTARNQMALLRGVKPFRSTFTKLALNTLENVKKDLRKNGYAKKDDRFIAVSGTITGEPGHTDSIRLVTM